MQPEVVQFFKDYFQDEFDKAFNFYLKNLPGFDVSFINNCTVTFLTLPHSYLPNREDNMLMVPVFLVLADLQHSKEGTYGRSWCKRGELDTFFNLARKFDRLENMMIKGAQDEVGEARIDTVGDTANYGLLWMTYFVRENPEEFLKWTQNNTNA